MIFYLFIFLRITMDAGKLSSLKQLESMISSSNLGYKGVIR